MANYFNYEVEIENKYTLRKSKIILRGTEKEADFLKQLNKNYFTDRIISVYKLINSNLKKDCLCTKTKKKK